MLWQGSTLVIDDKIEDGRPISEQLTRLYIPHLFFHADEAEIINFQDSQTPKIKNVRVIFQDINLTGSASPSKSDYEKAQTIIETVLEENNGPWLLITWSTWSGDDDDEYGKALFQHLSEGLDAKQRPYKLLSLNKSEFTQGKHGNVKSSEQLSESQYQSLRANILEVAKEQSAMDAVMAWENAVSNATSDIMAQLHSLSIDERGTLERANDRLGKLLFELAKAELGRSVTKDNAKEGLLNLLNTLLHDGINTNTDIALDLLNFKGVSNWSDIKEWKRKINRVLHFSILEGSRGPGTIYTYESFLKAKANCYLNTNGVATDTNYIDENSMKKEFVSLIDKFDFKGVEQHKEPISKCINDALMIVLEITPPCDHAQNKAQWLKFVGGVFIDIDNLSGSQLNTFKKIFVEPEYLWNSCDINLDKNNLKNSRLLLNSKLIFTVVDNENITGQFKYAEVTKIKEQITRDLIHWIGRQLTRPGYTYM